MSQPSLISLLMPTRGRPRQARRLLDSVAAHSRHLDRVEVIIYADEDDVDSHSLDHPGVVVKRIIGPRRSMGYYNTRCLQEAEGGIIALINDDVIIRTPDWDERLRRIDDLHGDKVYLAYCNDLFKGARLAAFPILSRATCEVLDEPFPTIYKGAFIDVHLMDIFIRMARLGVNRIRYLDEVVFEHMHYRTGKSARDATYRARSRFADDDAFLAMGTMRQALAHRLLARVNRAPLPALPPALETVSHPPLLALSRSVLLDRGLPRNHRLKTWIWFLARRMAAPLRLG